MHEMFAVFLQTDLSYPVLNMWKLLYTLSDMHHGCLFLKVHIIYQQPRLFSLSTGQEINIFCTSASRHLKLVAKETRDFCTRKCVAIDKIYRLPLFPSLSTPFPPLFFVFFDFPLLLFILTLHFTCSFLFLSCSLPPLLSSPLPIFLSVCWWSLGPR